MAANISSSTVCVVGGGPVGLFTALLLAQAGIDVAVFEKEEDVVKAPRAMGYFDVTQREFHKAGILNDIKAAGLINDQGLKWRRPKDGPYLAEVPGGPDPNRWPVQLGQHEVGKIILTHLTKYPKVEVNFGHSLQSLEQNEGGGTVSSRYTFGPNGNTREHTSRFLVGADGGKSTVRRFIDSRLEGFTWENFQMIASNIEYDLGGQGWAPGNMVLGDDVWGIVAKISKGELWRVAYGVNTSELDPEEPYNQERELARCRSRLARLLPGPTEQAQIKSISLYRLRQMSATEYVRGRVALVGDSAHLTSPVGGLGLTTGVLDAALLGRVLKQIILESKPLSLLEKYGKTRKDVFENVVSPSAIHHTKMVTGMDAESLTMREEFLEKVNKRDFSFLGKMGQVYQNITSTADDEPVNGVH